MEYRKLGNTGISISILGINGSIFVNENDLKEYTLFIEKAISNGINYFDSVFYGENCESEKILGKILKQLKVQRESIVISSKIIYSRTTDLNNIKPTSMGSSRKSIIESCNESLKRLQINYIDLIYALRDDEVSIEEICRAYNYLIEKGYYYNWINKN